MLGIEDVKSNDIYLPFGTLKSKTMWPGQSKVVCAARTKTSTFKGTFRETQVLIRRMPGSDCYSDQTALVIPRLSWEGGTEVSQIKGRALPVEGESMGRLGGRNCMAVAGTLSRMDNGDDWR